MAHKAAFEPPQPSIALLFHSLIFLSSHCPPSPSPLYNQHAGGYLVFIALEALRGKKVDENVEKAVQAGGFLLLMTAGVSLIVKDTLNLTGLGSMFQ